LVLDLPRQSLHKEAFTCQHLSDPGKRIKPLPLSIDVPLHSLASLEAEGYIPMSNLQTWNRGRKQHSKNVYTWSELNLGILSYDYYIV
jgi:hypothetical protein